MSFSCAVVCSRVSTCAMSILDNNNEQVFSWAILSGALRILHRVSPVQCSKSIKTTLHRGLFSVEWCLESLKDNIAHTHTPLINLCKVVLGVLTSEKTLQKMFSCAILSKYVRDNIAQENYLCNVGPELSDIIFWKNNQNLPEPILHKTITHAVLAHSPQPSHCFLNTQLLFSNQVIESKQSYLNTPETMLYIMAQHYLCNVGPGCTVIFYHRNINITGLSWSTWTNITQENYLTVHKQL